MDRKDFILKGTGLVFLGGLSMLALAQQSEDTIKKYTVISQRCDGCGHCFRSCRDKALLVAKDGKAVIDEQKCKGCGDCTRFCRRTAIIEKA